MLQSFLVVAASAGVLLFLKLRHYGKRENDLPPGPPTTILLGNAAQYPANFPHFQFTEWARTYGDIYSLKILNQTMVVLSSPAAAKYVLDKHGLITGARPKSHMADEALGTHIVIRDTDSREWKVGRKATHIFLSDDRLKGHSDAQRLESVQLLYDISSSPEKLYTHVRRAAVSVLTYAIYGKRLPHYEGTEAELFFHAVKLLNELLDPMAHPPIDLFPPLKYVPARWAPWKVLCEVTKSVRNKLYNGLVEDCEASMKSGERNESFFAKVKGDLAKLEMSRDDAIWTAKILMDAGVETSTSFIQSFILALINYPECQRQAQMELDRVVGSERSPTIEDMLDLPYTNALMKEVHRFRPIIPLGVPHVSTTEIKYRDYVLPVGTIFIPNIWGMYHDPAFFDEPENFKPERYLNSEFGTRADIKADADGFRDNLHFGFGRRVCPGADFATGTITTNALNLLWAFNFAKDSSGTGSIDMDAYQTPGADLAPKPFSCSVVVRDDRRAALIKEWYIQSSK